MNAVHDVRWRVSDWWSFIRRGGGGVVRERACGLCEGERTTNVQRTDECGARRCLHRSVMESIAEPLIKE